MHLDSLTLTLTRANHGPLLVHSGARNTAHLVDRTRDRASQLEAHLANINALADGRSIFMPSFNYDYCRNGLFDIPNDPSQVGPISERFRLSTDTRRTSMPVFNFATNSGAESSQNPAQGGDLDPFDDASVFADIVAGNGTIVWYGAPLTSMTLMHHAERSIGGVPYRYDKFFCGRVMDNNEEWPTRLRYHVWPMGTALDYDWGKLEIALRDGGILQSHNNETSVQWADAEQLKAFLTSKLRDDPLSLLTISSRAWVADHLDRLGRAFRIEDFE